MTTLADITVVASPRARRISITVKPSGEVHLVYPHSVPRERAMAFLDEKREWVEHTRRRLAERRASLPPARVALLKADVEELRRMAKVDLPPRVERIAAATGLHYEKLTIRASRSKWGSCSGRNNISLSLYLVALPEHLRDFVILHELCHTRYHNHSPRFHALVDRFCGGAEKALSRELKGYAIRG